MASSLMSRRTPPTLQEPKMTRPPVVASTRSNSLSRTRQECMKRFSKPKESAISPSHSKWLWIRDISPQITRRYWALSGTSIFMAPSTAWLKPWLWMKLQIPQMRSPT